MDQRDVKNPPQAPGRDHLPQTQDGFLLGKTGSEVSSRTAAALVEREEWRKGEVEGPLVIDR